MKKVLLQSETTSVAAHSSGTRRKATVLVGEQTTPGEASIGAAIAVREPIVDAASPLRQRIERQRRGRRGAQEYKQHERRQ